MVDNSRDDTLTSGAPRVVTPQKVMLVAQCGDLAPSPLKLMRSEVVVGRRPGDAPNVAFDDQKMSKQHARFSQLAAGIYTVDDCDSKNGTWHNGAPADGRIANAGDVIRVGDTVLVVAPIPEKRAEPIEGLVGESAAMISLRERVLRLAASGLSVLIAGETGSGKEVAAQALHAHSGRSGEFVAINCAAIPQQLVERELFGHVRGAYTGADRAGEGLIQTADGGTLFLDEIGELPLEVQAKLLRFLEDGQYRPVGSPKPRRADVRVIAATNRDLLEMVGDNAFREDLYARLDQAVIDVPPLRARREDLWSLIVTTMTREFGRVYSCDPDFIEALALYDWPRNVRELITVIKRIPHLGEAAAFTLADLPEGLQKPLLGRIAHRPSRAELAELLRQHRGNIHAVADDLKRDRKQVYRWLTSHKLDPDLFRR